MNNVSERTIRTCISNLHSKEYIKVIIDRKEKNNTSNESMREDLIIGRNAVIEALKSDRTIECVYVSKGDLEGSIKVALGLAKDKGVVIKEADRRKLDTMCDGLNHQGIVARVTPFKYCEVNDILEDAKRKEQQPFIVILDEIEAALDDVNVYRFADYLKKFSKETQFLVITHRKGTMEAADTVYGITMEENGISKLLSIKLA